MSKDYNWRRGRWEVDNIRDAHELKQSQSDPVYIYDRETKEFKEYKEKVKVKDLKMKDGKFIDKEGQWKDDIWD